MLVGIAYMVAHLLAEKHMLTSDSKLGHRPGSQAWVTGLGHRPGSQDILAAERNFMFGINIT